MSIHIKHEDATVSLQCEYIAEDNSFRLYSHEIDGVRLIDQSIQYMLTPYTDFQSDDFILYTLVSDNLLENNIYQIKFDQDQDTLLIGWAFPVQALLSDDHDYRENQSFLKHAYIAKLKLLNGDGDVRVKTPQYQESYQFKDFYDSNLAVLIISKQHILGLDFSVDNYLPSLYEKINLEKPIGKYLKIHPVSNELRGNGFVTKLFVELLNLQKHHLLKFMLLYQMIEFFLERILEIELKKCLTEIEQGLGVNFFDFQKKFNNLSNESDRLKQLFSTNYTRPQRGGDRKQLKDRCNELLKSVGKEEKRNESDALYAVRSLLVHNYRSISEQDVELLEKINRLFELVLIDIINNYVEPVAQR